jgi:multiple sugar transport system permease protein
MPPMPHSVPPKRPSGLTRVQKQDLRNAMLFISPWIVGFVGLMAYPIVMSIYYSLCDFSVLQAPQFVGAANYRELASDDVFRRAMSNTFVYAAAAIPLGIVLAFIIAMLLNTGVKGMAVYRTIFFLPSLVPAIAMGILWLWIFNGKSGILNYLVQSASRPVGWATLGLLLISPLFLAWFLGRSLGDDGKLCRWGALAGAVAGFGLVGLGWKVGWIGSLTTLELNPPSWLSDTFWVKPAFILMSLWGTGHAVVIYLAGLQNVPVHLYEAADLDGANWWEKTRNVTVPMMSPVILFNGIMAIIGTFNFFAIPFVMAPGGQPARSAYFLAVNLFDNAFLYLRMGYASAMAWILFLIVFLLTMLAMKLSEKHVHYGGS